MVAFDLATSERIPITGEEADRPFGPAIDGDRVVCSGDREAGVYRFRHEVELIPPREDVTLISNEFRIVR